MTRVPKSSVLKAWGMRLAKRSGLRKPKLPSRKLAVNASHVDRPNRVQLIATSKRDHRVPAERSGGGEIARFFASSQ
jgi:hypothetical protein